MTTGTRSRFAVGLSRRRKWGPKAQLPHRRARFPIRARGSRRTARCRWDRTGMSPLAASVTGGHWHGGATVTVTSGVTSGYHWHGLVSAIRPPGRAAAAAAGPRVTQGYGPSRWTGTLSEAAGPPPLTRRLPEADSEEILFKWYL